MSEGARSAGLELLKSVAASPSEVKEMVKKYYTINLVMAADAAEKGREADSYTLLFLGPPGVGKTTAVREAAKEIAKMLGKQFVDISEADEETIERVLENPDKYFAFMRLIPAHINPEDIAFPLPNARKGYVKLLLQQRLAVFKKVPGIVFVDEITNIARPDVQSLLYALVNEREIEGVKLNPAVMIVAAGNPPGDIEGGTSLAGELPSALMNRFTEVWAKEPTVDEWIRYMNEKYGDKWDKSVAAYLKAFGESALLRPAPEETVVNFPTPRSWTKLAVILKLLKDMHEKARKSIEKSSMSANEKERVLNELSRRYWREVERVVLGTVGPSEGSRFLEYYKVSEYLPSPRELAENPKLIVDIGTGRAREIMEKLGGDSRGMKVLALTATAILADYLNSLWERGNKHEAILYAKKALETFNKLGEHEYAGLLTNLLNLDLNLALVQESKAAAEEGLITFTGREAKSIDEMVNSILEGLGL